jgi:hypothetical protein
VPPSSFLHATISKLEDITTRMHWSVAMFHCFLSMSSFDWSIYLLWAGGKMCLCRSLTLWPMTS